MKRKVYNDLPFALSGHVATLSAFNNRLWSVSFLSTNSKTWWISVFTRVKIFEFLL
jgi:hypothetical protein